ncbi:unnamed protein product, partial [Amoebophrya sp. A25]|eukprot:GSA25T00028003001.1
MMHETRTLGTLSLSDNVGRYRFDKSTKDTTSKTDRKWLSAFVLDKAAHLTID